MGIINNLNIHHKELSICTIVTDWKAYQLLYSSFQERGFNDSNCEFLQIDNSRVNAFNAYEGVKVFMNNANGKYVLIIHQDAFPLDTYNTLILEIGKLESIDPNWGVIGNAGKRRNEFKKGYMSLVFDRSTVPLKFAPVKVDTIDENVMIIKGGSGITVSRDMTGYHFYGFDLSSVAARLGYSVYVIDFPWRHLSPGTIDNSFLEARDAIQQKMANYISVHSMPTTCTMLYWGGGVACSILSLCRAIWMLNNNKCHQHGVFLLLNQASNNYFGFRYIFKIYAIVSIALFKVQFLFKVKKRRILSHINWWKYNWRTRIPAGIQKI